MQFKIDAKITSQLTAGSITYIGTSSGAIHVLNFEDGVFQPGIFAHTGPVSALGLTQAGTLVSGAWDRKVLIHAVPSPIEIAIFGDAIKSILCAFDSIYVGTGDGMTYRFDCNGNLICQKQHNKRFVDTMCPIGGFLATAGSDRTLRILRADTLDLVQQFDFINSIRCIQFKCGYLFMTCAEKLLRVFEVPDTLTGAKLGVQDITLVSEAKLPDWGNQFALIDDFKLSGIFVGCADKSLKRVIGSQVETVASGATDNILTVEIVKETIKLENVVKECYMVIYGGADCYIRRIFLRDEDRKYFVSPETLKEIDPESSDFEDEEVKRMQEARLREMLKEIK